MPQKPKKYNRRKMTRSVQSPQKGHISMMAQTQNRNKKVYGKRVSQLEAMSHTILQNGVLVLAAPLIMIRKASYIMLLLLVTGLMIVGLLSPVQLISHLALLLALLILIILNLSAWFVMIVGVLTRRSTTTVSQTLRQQSRKHSVQSQTKH